MAIGDIRARGGISDHLALRLGLLVIGVITATPGLVLLDPEPVLSVSYGVRVSDPMVLTLLLHRGVFQLVLGFGIVLSAFYRQLRIPFALTAITTKGFFSVSVLSHEVIRAQWPVPVAIFDLTSIVVLAGVIVGELRRLRDQKAPPN